MELLKTCRRRRISPKAPPLRPKEDLLVYGRPAKVIVLTP